ncbi:MAG TPA: hypothetical protein VNT99_07260 [Methylomirabilota bacterium]|nr:hypothetical protein [Methylomirabilota bacterium]
MKRILCLAIAGVLAGSAAHARVKLVALPERARVVVSLNNPDATLVEEERLITLQKGVNKVDFSWRGVNIDGTSIQVRALSHPNDVKVLNTSYPPNENALVWEISSPAAQEERVRISYLLSGLTREVTYRAVAEPNEKSMTLRNYLRLHNNSGEDLTDAEVSVGYGSSFKKTIAHEEVLEMLSERIADLPIRKVLTWDSASLPWDPEYQKSTVGIPLSYVVTNDKPSKLGLHTMLPGKVRIFIKTKDQPLQEGEQASEGVAFTGEDWAQLTPVDREMKLFIGQSRDVKVTQRKTKDDKTNLRRNNQNNIVLHDTDEIYKVEIENFKKEPVNLTVVEHVPGYWKMIENSHAAQFRKKDAFTFEYNLTLPAESNGDKKTTVTFNLTRLNVQGNEPSSF